MKMNHTEYMKRNSSCKDTYALHREYWGQFVTSYIKAMVLTRFRLELLQRSLPLDHHLNNIPLAQWDTLTGYPQSRLCQTALKEAGEGVSLSSGVCILKEAAKQIVEESMKKLQ